MSNSPLVVYTKLSPNHSGQRTHSIDRITPHCVVGQLSAESICGCFISTSRQASCNYGIGTDGRISMSVEEKIVRGVLPVVRMTSEQSLSSVRLTRPLRMRSMTLCMRLS